MPPVWQGKPRYLKSQVSEGVVARLEDSALPLVKLARVAPDPTAVVRALKEKKFGAILPEGGVGGSLLRSTGLAYKAGPSSAEGLRSRGSWGALSQDLGP
jgi:hypothetical protein